jgi:hypothetical protein
MIALISRPLAVVAAIGWIISVAASIAGMAGALLPQWLLGAASIALFPLWLVAVLIINKLAAGVRGREMWKAVLRGCPTWLRYAIWGSWGYAFLMFVLIAAGLHEAAGIGFLGVFYASALGAFVTAATTGDEPTQCANGHQIGPFDNFCRECGVAIKRTSTVQLVS